MNGETKTLNMSVDAVQEQGGACSVFIEHPLPSGHMHCGRVYARRDGTNIVTAMELSGPAATRRDALLAVDILNALDFGAGR